MNIIKTTSFSLAALSKGNENSERLAITLPGRLDTKDYASFASHMDCLSRRGFYALAFDPPGIWDSPGPIDLFTTTNYIKAVNEIIGYFGNRPTLLLGHSRGGTVSILVAKTNPAVVGAVIVMANFGSPTPPDPESVERGYKISYRDLPPGTSKTKEQKRFDLPISYFKDGEQYDPIASIKELAKPKLVLYGTRDEFVTPEKVKKIFQDVPEPKMIHELDSDHDYRRHPEAIEEVNKMTGLFLDKYL